MQTHDNRLSIAKSAFQVHGVDITGQVIWPPPGSCRVRRSSASTCDIHRDERIKIYKGFLRNGLCLSPPLRR